MLFLHQNKAVVDIRAMGGISLLKSPPGSGKTHIAGEVMRLILEKHGGTALYISEATALTEQKKKLEDCGNTAQIVSGSDRDWNVPQGTVAICSHSILRLDAKKIQAKEWTIVVVDESHKIECATKPTGRALYGMGQSHGIRSRFKIAMTATPTPNGLKDCYAYIRWLYPYNRWSSFTQFANECLIPHPHVKGAYIGTRNTAELERIMQSITVNVDYTPTYPEPSVIHHSIVLSPEERTAYNQLKENLMLDLANECLVVRTPAALLMKLRQMTAHPQAIGLELESTKEKELLEILANRNKGQKALVFCQFTTVLDVLARHHGWSVLKGGMTRKAKDKVREMQPDVLLLSPAGEASIDCQWATMVVNYDLPWSEGHIEQRNGRAAREGQTEQVDIHYITAKGTVDEQVDAVVKRKIKANLWQYKKYDPRS